MKEFLETHPWPPPPRQRVVTKELRRLKESKKCIEVVTGHPACTYYGRITQIPTYGDDFMVLTVDEDISSKYKPGIVARGVQIIRFTNVVSMEEMGS